MDPQERNDLMRQAADDSASFGRLAGAVKDNLYRLARAQGLDTHDAGDVVQETLLRAWGKRKHYQPGRDATNWLMGFAINVVRERRRAERRHNPTHSDDVGTQPVVHDDAHDETDRLADLDAALDALPDRQREVVACRYLRQMSVQQTADVLGIAEGTVKAATAAGLDNLRKRMHRHEPIA
jgi:RNA polymerase sigma-70 factor, ECF subfamily